MDSSIVKEIIINGESHKVQEGMPLYEYLVGKDLIQAGYCYHPLLNEEVSSCLLCLIKDEESGQWIPSCKETSKEGKKYSTARGLFNNSKDILEDKFENLFKSHEMNCSSCQNFFRCTLKEIIPGSVPKSEGKRIEKPKMDLGRGLTLELTHCIDCGICSTFEKVVTDSPAIKFNAGTVEVVDKLDHNMGVNLISLCPTGCFSHRDSYEHLKVKEQDFFCRGCERLCELRIGLSGEGHIVSVKNKDFLASWICDFSLSQIKSNNTMSIFVPYKMDSELGPIPSSFPSRQKDQHFVLFNGLPDEIYFALDKLFEENDAWTFELINWDDRESEKGLLRKGRNFKSLQEEEFKLKFVKREKQRDINPYVILSDFIPCEDTLKKALERVQKMKGSKVIAASVVERQLIKSFDFLVPLKPFHFYSWHAVNFNEESSSFMVDREIPKLFKEKVK